MNYTDKLPANTCLCYGSRNAFALSPRTGMHGGTNQPLERRGLHH